MIRALLVGLLVGLLGAATACNVNPYNLAGDGGGGGSGDGGGGGDGGGDGDGGIDAPDDAPTDAGCVPRPETCNEADDDCDGMIDEGFNLDADPRNCGTCGNRCEYDNAIGVCNGGDCEQGACRPGWNDTVPGTPGCEYFCIQTNGGVEVCDDRDNDCDNAVDEDFDLDDDVNNCGRCGHVCNLLHATATCNGGDCEVASCDPGFVDLNPAVPGCEYQCTPTNGGVEACDGVDNNCDGVVDDGNPGGGQPCGTDTGECSAGTFQCSNGVLFCVGAIGGTLEVCDGLDNDCAPATTEVCSSGCVVRVRPDDGRRYLFCAIAANQATARSRCTTELFRLARVDDQAENTYLRATTTSAIGNVNVWLGASDAAVEGAWRWDDGAQFWQGGSGGVPIGGLYENWDSGEPNNSDNEDCGELRTNSLWNDVECSAARAFICERY